MLRGPERILVFLREGLEDFSVIFSATAFSTRQQPYQNRNRSRVVRGTQGTIEIGCQVCMWC